MDPLSITVACVSLTASIAKTSFVVTTFVRAVRSARSDLDAVSRELASLTTLLELIAEDAKDIDAFPKPLRKHISGILTNCELVLVEVQRLIEKYDQPGFIKSSKWALTGSEDVAKLQLSLEAHKSALEIALEMVTLSITREIKNDTTTLRDDAAVIKHDAAAIKHDTSEILQEIARLRAQLPDDQATLRPNTQASDSTLARYLDDLTSYAETVCWSGEDSDTDVEKDDVIVRVKSKSRSPTTSIKMLEKVSLPPVTAIPSPLKKDIASTVPPPAGEPSPVRVSQPLSAAVFVDLSSGVGGPRPSNFPRVKSLPKTSQHLDSHMATPGPHISASASDTDLASLSRKMASLSGAENGAPNTTHNPQSIPEGIRKRLDNLDHKEVPPSPARAPIYFQDRMIGNFRLKPFASNPNLVLPKEVNPFLSSFAQTNAANTAIQMPPELVVSMAPKLTVQPPPEPIISKDSEPMVQKAPTIPVTQAISALNAQADELGELCNSVQRIFDDKTEMLSKQNEMKLRDFLYKIQTLQIDVNFRAGQMRLRLSSHNSSRLGNPITVQADSVHYAHQVQAMHAEFFDIARSIGRTVTRNPDAVVRSSNPTITRTHKPSKNGSPDQLPIIVTPTLFQVRAIHTFVSTDENDLNFEKGQIIDVVDDQHSDWHRGFINGIEPKLVGLFPTNYVEKCRPQQSSPWIHDQGPEQWHPSGTITRSPDTASSGFQIPPDPYVGQRGSDNHFYGGLHDVPEVLGKSIPRRKRPDSVAIDTSPRNIEQTESPSPNNSRLSVVSDRDSRNTLTTIPQDWYVLDYLGHSGKDTLTIQNHVKNGEHVVVKSYRRRPDDERSYKVRIMREAETLGLFNHPHIVHLRYFSRTSDFWLLYLENVGSTTLSQYIARHGRLSRAAKSQYDIWDASNWEDTTRKFARQIGSALRYCHLNCIHHYNLHSEKIMVTSKGNIKLTGFGKMQLVSIVEDETFDTFSYGTIIWQMMCGFTPWPVNENWDEYLRNTSTLVTNPGYLSPDCFHLLSGLLNGDRGISSSQRLSLKAALEHSWMLVDFNFHVPDYMPQRRPLTAPLDEAIIRKLRLYGFGNPTQIQQELSNVVQSSVYLDAIIAWTNEKRASPPPEASPPPKFGIRQSFKKGLNESWAKSRAKRSSKSEPAPVEPVTPEPTLEFYDYVHSRVASPTLAVYYLAKEKMEREKSRLSFETMSPIVG